MRGREMLEAIENLDPAYIEAVAKKPKVRRLDWLKWGAMAACFCVAILGIFIVNMYQNQHSTGTLPGDSEVYPTVMVNGQLYEWRKGVAICDEIPEDCLYYGKLIYVEKNSPENDCEFSSTFSASGDIYTMSDSDSVYVCISTEWLNNTFVIFDAVKTG